MILRPSKELTKTLIAKQAPEYMVLFEDFKSDANGWLILPKKLVEIQQLLGIAGYVTLYRDQQTIDMCLILALRGIDGTKAFNKQMLELTQKNDEQANTRFFNDLIETASEFVDGLEVSISSYLPNTQTDSEFNISVNVKAEENDLLKKRLFWIHILLGIHNYLSVMVNGESMVSLVPKAISGDDASLLKAIKIDPSLVVHHPYFIKRITKAKFENDSFLLRGLSKSQATPNLESRIRLPGVYIIFAMLELGEWLDEFTHEEILDLCDDAGLDRWQHKIEDVNAITKCLATYRRNQKSGRLSMQ